MKPYYKSKTFWLGVIQLLMALLSVWQGWLSTDSEVSLLISGIVVVILRWFTAEPITSVHPAFDRLRPRIQKAKQAGHYGHKFRSEKHGGKLSE